MSGGFPNPWREYAVYPTQEEAKAVVAVLKKRGFANAGSNGGPEVCYRRSRHPQGYAVWVRNEVVEPESEPEVFLRGEEE